MKMKHVLVILAASGVIGLGVPVAHAQKATTIEQAEMAGLSPKVRAEVEARMKQQGQTVSEVLQTILLNSIKAKHPASSIVALDFNRGAAVVQLTSGGMAVVPFNTTTLEIK